MPWPLARPLTGGLGSLAFWSDTENVTGGTINSGHMSLETDATNAGCDVWKLDSGESAPLTYAAGDKLVPGDVLTKSCAFTLKATGNHLRGQLAVSTPALSNNWGSNLVADVKTSINGGPLAANTEITELDNGKKVTGVITLTFKGTAGNDTQDLTSVLSDLTLNLTQIHA